MAECAVASPDLGRLARPRRGRPGDGQQAVVLRMLVQQRKDAGLDQTALARRLSITQSEVSKFERGERALDVLTLRAWLRVLGSDLTSFADALDRELAPVDPFLD